MKLNKLQQLLIGLGFILLVNGLVFLVFSQGARNRIEAAKASKKKYQGDIENARRIQMAATELQEQMNQLNSQLDGLKKILPLEINFPRFLSDFKRIANESGLEIKGVSNNQPIVDDVIVEHPLVVKAVGGYHDFGYFFEKMTNYPRILNFKSLQMERNVKESRRNLVDGYFIISLFTYREPTVEELQAQYEKVINPDGDKKKGRKKGGSK